MSSSPAPGTVTLKQWNATALWAWDLDADACSICQTLVMIPCLHCAGKTKPDCKIAWGECGHAFHQHCIERWAKIRSVCPIDDKAWVVKRICSPNDS